MKQPSWDSFTRKIYINAPLKRVLHAWTSQKEITTWFLKYAGYISEEGLLRKSNDPFQSGDQYVWEWHNSPVKGEGKIMENNSKDKFVLSFDGSVVTIKLTRENEMTLLSLTQHEIPTDDTNKMKNYVHNAIGWSFWLTNLKAYIEHDVLLHDRTTDHLHVYSSEFINM